MGAGVAAALASVMCRNTTFYIISIASVERAIRALDDIYIIYFRLHNHYQHTFALLK